MTESLSPMRGPMDQSGSDIADVLLSLAGEASNVLPTASASAARHVGESEEITPNVFACSGSSLVLRVGSHSADYVVRLESANIPTVEASSSMVGYDDESMAGEVGADNTCPAKRHHV